jgi:hypothetical protein
MRFRSGEAKNDYVLNLFSGQHLFEQADGEFQTSNNGPDDLLAILGHQFPPLGKTSIGVSIFGSSGRSGITNPHVTQTNPTWAMTVSICPDGLCSAGSSFSENAFVNTKPPQSHTLSFRLSPSICIFMFLGGSPKRFLLADSPIDRLLM